MSGFSTSDSPLWLRMVQNLHLLQDRVESLSAPNPTPVASKFLVYFWLEIRLTPPRSARGAASICVQSFWCRVAKIFVFGIDTVQHAGMATMACMLAP